MRGRSSPVTTFSNFRPFFCAELALTHGTQLRNRLECVRYKVPALGKRPVILTLLSRHKSVDESAAILIEKQALSSALVSRFVLNTSPASA